MKVAFDAHARKPDTENLEKEPIVQSRLSEHLRFGEAEEPKVGLIVDDPGGVDVLPAHVLIDPIAGHAILLARAPDARAPAHYSPLSSFATVLYCYHGNKASAKARAAKQVREGLGRIARRRRKSPD